jgi:hypothetical protein
VCGVLVLLRRHMYAGVVGAAECTTAPVIRSLSTPTGSHNRSPIQTSKNSTSPPPPLATSRPL